MYPLPDYAISASSYKSDGYEPWHVRYSSLLDIPNNMGGWKADNADSAPFIEVKQSLLDITAKSWFGNSTGIMRIQLKINKHIISSVNR